MTYDDALQFRNSLATLTDQEIVSFMREYGQDILDQYLHVEIDRSHLPVFSLNKFGVDELTHDPGACSHVEWQTSNDGHVSIANCPNRVFMGYYFCEEHIPTFDISNTCLLT